MSLKTCDNSSINSTMLRTQWSQKKPDTSRLNMQCIDITTYVVDFKVQFHDYKITTVSTTLTDKTRRQLYSCLRRCERCRGCCMLDVPPTCHQTLWLSTIATHKHTYTHTHRRASSHPWTNDICTITLKPSLFQQNVMTIQTALFNRQHDFLLMLHTIVTTSLSCTVSEILQLVYELNQKLHNSQ